MASTIMSTQLTILRATYLSTTASPGIEPRAARRTVAHEPSTYLTATRPIVLVGRSAVKAIPGIGAAGDQVSTARGAAL